jgi:hypothetical protein
MIADPQLTDVYSYSYAPRGMLDACARGTVPHSNAHRQLVIAFDPVLLGHLHEKGLQTITSNVP